MEDPIDETRVFNGIDKFFNNSLKQFINYPETFEINVDLESNKIKLTPNQYSILINTLINDKYRIIQLEQSLLKGFKNVDFNMSNINIYPNIINNEILITYTYKSDIINHREIGIYINIASNLNNKDLSNFCSISSVFYNASKDSTFWRNLYMHKYPKYSIIAKNTKRDYNWKDITLSMERVSTTILFDKRLGTDCISYLFKNHYEIAKYYILENIWIPHDLDIDKIPIYLNYQDDGLIILDYIILTYGSQYNIPVVWLYNHIEINSLNTFHELLTEKIVVGPHNYERIMIDILINSHKKGLKDVLFRYKFMLDVLKVKKDDDLYLEHYVNVKDNYELSNYILSNISNNISLDKIRSTLEQLMSGNLNKMISFYEKYRKKYLSCTAPPY